MNQCTCTSFGILSNSGLCKFCLEGKKNCQHEVAEIPGDYYKDDEWRSDGAYCSKCGSYLFEWYCPYSPDHLCSYPETPDSCKYCGMPDERK